MSAVSQFKNDMLNSYELQDILKNLLGGTRVTARQLEPLIDFMFRKIENVEVLDQDSYDKGYDKGYEDGADEAYTDDRYDEGYEEGFAEAQKKEEKTDLQKAKEAFYGPSST